MSHCSHQHSHHQAKNTAAYAAVFVAAFGVIEAAAGYYSGSLTLLSDAGHMGADALALSLAAFASWIKHRPTTTTHTYGFGRIEVIASWLSSLLLLVIVTSIAVEAFIRLQKPQDIASKPVIIVAIIGLGINIVTAWILHHGEKTINMRAAFLHVLGDLLGSVAVLISGLIIYFTNWVKIDPILSLVISGLILIATINILKESWLILMECKPSHVDFNLVERTIKNVANVQAIHDLHIWTLTSGVALLTVHVVVDDCKLCSQIIDEIRDLIQKDFGITHTTIQIETTDQKIPCINCNCK